MDKENIELNKSNDVLQSIPSKGVIAMGSSAAAPSATEYNVNYTLEKSQIAPCNVPNELIIDNTGDDYDYQANQTKVNNQTANLNLNTAGSLITLNALNNNQVLSFQLKDDGNPHPINYIPDEDCIDTAYGFKLSEVIASIGNFLRVSQDDYQTSNNEGDLTLIQKAFIVEKNCQRYIVFNFYFKNNGNEAARRVLFKDILPQGVNLTFGGIFVNGCYAYPEYSNIEGRRLLMRIPDIQKRGSSNLTLICTLSKDHCPGDVNVGVVSYVSRFYQNPAATLPSKELTQFETGIQQAQSSPKYNVNIRQCISNMKSIDECKEGRGFCEWIKV